MTAVQLWKWSQRGDIRVGTVHGHRGRGTETSTLMYDPAYIAAGGVALDPATPLGTASVQTPVGHALPRALQDCMPDRWGRTLVQQQERVLAREQGRTPRTLGEARPAAGCTGRPATGRPAAPARRRRPMEGR